MCAEQNPDQFAGLQELLLATTSLQDFLGEVASQARDAQPDQPVSCGLTVQTSPKRPYTIGSSDGYASQLDEVQYTARAGPCLHTLDSGTRVEIPNLAEETRWPQFVTEAAAAGVGSTLSVPLQTRTDTVGALNYYLPHPSDGGARVDQLAQAEHFAAHAGGAVALALQLTEQSRLNADLQTALSSRSTIDQALGILMSQQRCPADAAFDTLRRHSQNHNTALRDVAANLIRQVTGTEPQPGPAVT